MARLPGVRCCDLAARGSLPPLGLACRPRRLPRASALRYSSLQAGDSLGEDVLRMFLEDRQENGDFVSKVADMVLRRNDTDLEVLEATMDQGNAADVGQPDDFRDDVMSEGVVGFEATGDFVSAEDSLTMRRRLSALAGLKESDKRKEFNLLRYEAIKDELLLLTVGIGAACTIYCVLVFSLEAGISYAFGVAFSWLYLQLLYRHADNLSKEDVPEVFLKKKVKKIGIRSEDLKDTLEKTLGGSLFVLSSPRLIIPAVIFGLSTFSSHFQNNIFNFELVPGMMGFFAYKAAALVQVYRDNDDLRLILPDDDPDYS
ncbi:hypothetical protein CFC21_061790 [Triticum aestivum]|uniref:Calcium uniporter protein n=2 Tax=Triticum aestivum TaxID=4565 RepID=A0A9R1GVL4_WHEAT|nr:uncharacterized protein LOC123097609 isoform X2 [Triticum aestivum]KAF7054014.1 hypothetical protein CFC21_061790 [Triticum aestivum]